MSTAVRTDLGLFFVAAGSPASSLPRASEAAPRLAGDVAGNAAEHPAPMMLGRATTCVRPVSVNPLHNGFHSCSACGPHRRGRRGPALLYVRGVAIFYALLAFAGLLPATQTGSACCRFMPRDLAARRDRARRRLFRLGHPRSAPPMSAPGKRILTRSNSAGSIVRHHLNLRAAAGSDAGRHFLSQRIKSV